MGGGGRAEVVCGVGNGSRKTRNWGQYGNREVGYKDLGGSLGLDKSKWGEDGQL